jgi:hypothetical protein
MHRERRPRSRSTTLTATSTASFQRRTCRTATTGCQRLGLVLFANPNVLPAFEIVFLNGRRTPVIERVEMPANMLGMGFRSYIDIGINTQDPRAAVMVKGEA